MLENYICLLGYINAQMNTDYAEDTDTIKSYITYYLEHIDLEYKWILSGIIPLETIKEKILDVSFGFGDPKSDEDKTLYLEIKERLYEEMEYRKNVCKCSSIDTLNFYQCWQCQVRDCGCKADPSCCGEY